MVSRLTVPAGPVPSRRLPALLPLRGAGRPPGPEAPADGLAAQGALPPPPRGDGRWGGGRIMQGAKGVQGAKAWMPYVDHGVCGASTRIAGGRRWVHASWSLGIIIFPHNLSWSVFAHAYA